APLAHGEVPTGRDVLLSLTSGIVGGVGPDLVRGRSTGPDLSGLAVLDPGPLGVDPTGLPFEASRVDTGAPGDVPPAGTRGDGGRGGDSTGPVPPYAHPESGLRAGPAEQPSGAEPARRDPGEGVAEQRRPDAPELAGLAALEPP